MRYFSRTALFVSALCAGLAFAAPALAVDDIDSSSFITGSTMSMVPDVRTGSFLYQYPLTLPPGRNGMQPSLQLSYDSNATDVASIVGYGWSLSMPSIDRVALHGSDDLYSRHDFRSSLVGDLEDVSLSDSTHGTYGAEVESGSFATYVYNTDESWTVTDARGTVYTFGATSAERLSDPADATHVYRWFLSSVEDTNGNTVTYTYTTVGNQLYPASINYTGSGTASGIFDVDFTYEIRTDATTSYASGFAVTTSYRLATVSVRVSGTVARMYTLAYDTGDNGTRSLLASVTETGVREDGTTDTKPATSFTYESGARSWTESTLYTLPLTIAGTGNGSLGVYIFDVNGDALADVVMSRDVGQGVYINNGDGIWTEDTNYTVPTSFITPVGRDYGVRILDVDGDGLLDMVWSRYDSMGRQEGAVYINNGDGTGWTETAGYTIPIGFTTDSGLDIGARVFDVDGDGMQDIVRSRVSDGTAVYINNGDGTGWTQDASYTVPFYFASATGRDMGSRPVDVNSDGLTDVIFARYNGSTFDQAVYINNGDGTGWTQDTSYTVPRGYVSAADLGVRNIDVNADGLTDFVASRYETTGVHEYTVYINDGNGAWNEDTSITVPTAFTNDSGIDIGFREVDLNGDGLDDMLRSRQGDAESFYLLDSGYADVLTGIAMSQGGSTTVTYDTSMGGNDDLPFTVKVVSSLTTDDGFGNTATTSYSYADGDYYWTDEYDRQVAGFGMVDTTDALGNVTRQYFHQGNGTSGSLGESTDDRALIGRVYREEVYDETAHLYKTTITSWINVDLGNDRDFAYATQTLELLYDADSDHRDHAVTYTYDTASGNLTQVKDWGLVTGSDSGTYSDSGTDMRRTDYVYATWATGGASSYPYTEILRDSSGNRWRHTIWYYDGATGGSVSTGNVSKESRWVTGSTVVDTTYTYDSFGRVATSTDPRGNVTTYTPDAANLYNATVTDALLYATTFAYDYTSGKPTAVTDPNGLTMTYDFDGFDRPLAEWQPDPDATSTMVEKVTWTYDDASFPSLVTETRHISATIARDTVTYLDGFGRPVQQRAETETSGTYTVSDTIYDALGRAAEVSLPYESSGSAFTSPTTDTALYEATTFDALGRPTATTNAAGTRTKSYEDWWVTETDAESNVKLYYYDAWGRLAVVGERLNGTTTYTTYYTWTAGDDLTKITDGAGNIRQFAYDNLGRRTSAGDVHATTDGAYGTWTFTYDNASNVATSVSPLSVTTTYAYDTLNRKTSENITSSAATDITYVYDSCTNGVGRLCTATVDDGATTTYTYDILGRVRTETKTISGTSYVTTYAYDRQGGVTSVTYPDGSEANYTFDIAGGLETVTFDDVHGSATETVVSNVAYGPHGKVTSVTYGNGVTSTWTYDAGELYRLSAIDTLAGATVLQDFSYSYDNVGNITSIVDASSLYAGITYAYGYDDLYRITSAVATSTDSALTYSKTWTYGAIGNILTSTDCGTYQYLGYQAGNYANSHAVTSVCGKTYTYDRNGNVTSDGTWTNTWNWRNELTGSTNGTTTISYQYDHEGNRARKSSGSSVTAYPNTYYDIEDSTVRRHITAGVLGGIAIATWDGSTSDVVYHHKDHLGSTHVETDESGAVLEYLLYKPFGETLVDIQSSSYENDRKYTGKELDNDTNYHYYGARYYKADIGRFLSQDPAYLVVGADKQISDLVLRDPQLMNSYAYARNNPIVLLDPDGEFVFMAPLIAFVLANAPAIAASAVVATTAIGSVMFAQSYEDMTSPTSSLTTRAFGAMGVAATFMPMKPLLPAAKTTTTTVKNIAPLAIEASPAARVGIQYSAHAIARMEQRGVTPQMVELTLQKGAQYFDPKSGALNYILKNGFASGKDLLVGTNPTDGQVRTVLRGTDLVNSRFIQVMTERK